MPDGYLHDRGRHGDDEVTKRGRGRSPFAEFDCAARSSCPRPPRTTPPRSSIRSRVVRCEGSDLDSAGDRPVTMFRPYRSADNDTDIADQPVRDSTPASTKG